MRSKVERLITLSTSAVAVCCCSDSLEVAGPLLNLSEQVHIGNGDHRLVGEGLQHLDMMIGEGARLDPRDADDADGLALEQQRDPQRAAPSPPAHDRQLIGLTGKFYFGVDDPVDLAPADSVAVGESRQRPGIESPERRIGRRRRSSVNADK